jgi:DNA-binding transcriptional MerR regulator
VSDALSISEASERTGLSTHTLRYWERAGLLEPVERNGSGHRRYADNDLLRITFLTRLRATGMPIREVRRYAELIKGGDATNEERLQLLEAHRRAVLAQLEETAGHLELIDLKINLYRERLGKKDGKAKAR